MVTYNNDGKGKWQSYTISFKDTDNISNCFHNSFPDANAVVFGYGLEDIAGYGATKEEAIENYKIALGYLMDQLKEFEEMVMTPGSIENNLVEVDCFGKPLEEGKK